jgi:hypothetical protein
MTCLTTPFDDVLGAPTAAAVAYVAMVTSRHRPSRWWRAVLDR